MTPLAFEQRFGAEWDELAVLLDAVEGIARKARSEGGFAEPKAPKPQNVEVERLAALYRRACEHLALARARAYPVPMIARLDALAHRAHQAIYRRRDYGWARLAHLFQIDFPQAVRAHAGYVWAATALFLLPMLVLGWLTFERPSFALTMMDARQLVEFEAMYSEARDSIGRTRDADSDWTMFGFYIKNNISVSFQCFAGGLVAGIGAALALMFNGLHAGVIGGYLTARDLGPAFWSFVVTHAAFELTAIVLSGAAGLRLGAAWVMPGRRTRVQSLVLAARESVVVMYGVIAMLLVAAGIEAFWSSARWVPNEVKYGVAALCWVLVIGYLVRQGRGSL
jgi:uncharacterized membrane protein SpoIIM required for sporulation